ncbi:Protein-disulfide isomerase [Palleronia salina]|uniref:Protein-disulfide isomerase n=1 Tax=Palleronia salina TaxID=313368 RepID=A0A1M6E9Y0_9RHOB|nr:DsbA family protein [Palleronia salina]SHI82314.1 Protein-disulfide isomerase [Palleronia salina]
MNKIVPAIAAAAVLGAGAWYFSTTPGGAPGATSFQVEAQESSEADLSLVQEMSMGNPDADVTVIEYASFTCPHCRTFHDNVFDDLKENYIDSGKINFIYREVYFDRYGLWAGMVARCAGPDRYFGIADLIYERQSEWAQGEPAQIAQNLRQIGKTAGLGDDQLDACLNDAAKAQALVATYEQNAAADNIRATPSFVIDGENYSNMNYADFSAILDEKLAD